MQHKFKFLLIIFIFLITINLVSANEIGTNDSCTADNHNNITVKSSNNNDFIGNIKEYKNNNLTSEKDTKINNLKISSTHNESSFIKDTPHISIKSNKLKSRDSLVICLKNSKNIPLTNKKLNIIINSKNYSVSTNSEGLANLKLTLVPKKYNIHIRFSEDDELNANYYNSKIYVSKLNTKIVYYTNFVVKKGHFYIYLMGNDNNGISGKLKLKLRKKAFIRNTNKKGRVSTKINLKPGKYTITVKYKGNKYFNPTSKKITFYVSKLTTFKIGNNKLVRNGFLRVYLKSKNQKNIFNKKMLIKIGNKKYYKKTNSEGIIVLKVNIPSKTYNVIVKCGKYSIRKILNCIDDTVKDPLQNNITLVNGAPDIDYMPGNYVMGDNSRTYIIKRKQYLEVIKRDSYCLFLNNKLSKYVCFKTSNHPHTYHIIKREKWNVIEKEINRKLVKANKYKYYPSKIKVSLKGKSYKYCEFRDIQNTGYTCGPSSASMCSQVLRNYVNEKHLAKLSGTTKSGTKIQKLENALRKHNFICTHFYRNSFNYALDELKKGGCGVIFHSQHHYVSILDINSNGKKVLVSNSYGTYNKIPSRWLSVKYMKTKFGVWDDSLVVRLNYYLDEYTKLCTNCLYNSMGSKWNR